MRICVKRSVDARSTVTATVYASTASSHNSSTKSESAIVRACSAVTSSVLLLMMISDALICVKVVRTRMNESMSAPMLVFTDMTARVYR